jgi:hypothetical protein
MGVTYHMIYNYDYIDQGMGSDLDLGKLIRGRE